MVVQLKYANAIGNSVTFYTSKQNGQHAPYVLSGISGTGGPAVEYDRVALTGNDGSYLGDIRYGARSISTDCYIYGHSDSERDARLRQLNAVLNPRLGDGTLIYQNHEAEYRIAARCRVLPTFLPNTKIGDFKPVLIDYECAYPFFYDNQEQARVLASASRSFTMPFRFPAFLGQLTYSVTITNTSSIAVPIRVIINGPASNPRITNNETGESLKVRKEVLEGESLTIITGPRRSVTLTNANGDETSALGYVDVVYSQWIRLAPGANHLTYSSDDDSRTTLIEIYWRNWFLGVG